MTDAGTFHFGQEKPTELEPGTLMQIIFQAIPEEKPKAAPASQPAKPTGGAAPMKAKIT